MYKFYAKNLVFMRVSGVLQGRLNKSLFQHLSATHEIAKHLVPFAINPDPFLDHLNFVLGNDDWFSTKYNLRHF